MTGRAVWIAFVALALAYPVVILAGDGARFPTREECSRPAVTDGEIEAVFGYFEDEAPARELRDRALAVGFQGTDLAWDACGRIRVAVGGIPTLEVGREFAEQARGVGFDVKLEQAS